MNETVYREAIQYLYSFINYEKQQDYVYNRHNFNLERMHRLLERLGRPEQRWRSIHIAGTKGKTSTASMVSSILQQAGYRVGLYTSPHLVTVRERFLVNGVPISREEVCAMVERIRPVFTAVEQETGKRPTFFDAWTTLGFLHFAYQQVDLAVIEVGLGGRLDSTNVIVPAVAVITPIGFDHIAKLGNTLTAIAVEKAGIIKNGVPVVSAPQQEETWQVIRRVSAEQKAPLYEIGRDLTWTPGAADLAGQRLTIEGLVDRYTGLQIPLLGAHQLVNAAVAVGAVEVLHQVTGLRLGPQAVADGLQRTERPGRLQIVQQSPFVILDSAHNVMAIQALVKALRSLFRYRRAFVVVAISRDKDVVGICRALTELEAEFIAVRMRNKRGADPQQVASALRHFTDRVSTTSSMSEAIERALVMAGPDDLICLTGSIYMVGEALELFHNLEPEEETIAGQWRPRKT